MNTSKRFASFSQRLLAHNIDLIPILMLFYLSTLLPSTGFDYLIWLGIYLGYHTIFELSNWKGSPGKKWSKLKVINSSKKLPDELAIPIRNFSKIFSLLLFFGGFAMITFHSRRQGLHDYIAGTTVIFDGD